MCEAPCLLQDTGVLIVFFKDLSGNIPRGSAYGVYTSQLIRYARVCSYKEDFINRAALLKEKLKEKGFTEEKLRKTSRKCIHNNNWIIKKYQGSGFKLWICIIVDLDQMSEIFSYIYHVGYLMFIFFMCFICIYGVYIYMYR